MKGDDSDGLNRNATDPSAAQAVDLFDPHAGTEAFRLSTVDFGPPRYEPPRSNRFSVVAIESGAGFFWADTARHAFRPDSLLFFLPYQHIRFESATDVRVVILQFHANFLCVETFHAETGCSGRLFNDPYGVPIVRIDERSKPETDRLFERLRNEYEQRDLGFVEALRAATKLLLIEATRLKKPDSTESGGSRDSAFRHPLLSKLPDLIERNYRTRHAPSDYAKLLGTTPKRLGRVVREHLGKTLTALISERILTEGKWQLLHSLKPVREIAAELGFEDEFYFSRMFKKTTGFSPTQFREFETKIREGGNLSMHSASSSIPGEIDR